MGGLALARVEYTTWVRFSFKIIVTIAIVNLLIITLAMMLL